VKVYRIHADICCDSTSRTMTIMFEVPGVKPADVNVALSTEPHTRIKQLVVTGNISSPWPLTAPDDIVLSCERKFGSFRRGISIPSGTTLADIKAHLQDGILTVRLPLPPPAIPQEPVQYITVTHGYV
ncbi:hypothetical protein K488DRAFT_60689, partial [Vararia minispora EC-137]